MAGRQVSVSTHDGVVDLAINSSLRNIKASCNRPDYSSIHASQGII